MLLRQVKSLLDLYLNRKQRQQIHLTESKGEHKHCFDNFSISRRAVFCFVQVFKSELVVSWLGTLRFEAFQEYRKAYLSSLKASKNFMKMDALLNC